MMYFPRITWCFFFTPPPPTHPKKQNQVRGSAGEHSEAADGLYDISNKERMGLTEYEAVRKMYDGLRELIRMEQEKEKEEL